MNVETLRKSPALAAPEPGLTPEELFERAIGLRSRLRDEQQATEDRGRPSPEMHEAFCKAGFYRILQPRMFGGYEFGLDVFSRVIFEVARGCPGSGWYLSLASGHALNAGALFSEEGQRILFGADGEFRAPTRAIPTGTAKRTKGGWIVNGTWDYCSGVPYSTHAIVGLKIIDGDKPARIGMAAVQRDNYEILDNWRDFIGFKGSGSNSIKVEHAFIPDSLLVFQDIFALDIDGGTPGYHLHKNPMYSGRGFGFFQIEITSILVGTGFAALDEYEQLIRTRQAPMRPAGVLQHQDPDFQRAHGIALGQLEFARLALEAGAKRYMDLCRRGVEEIAQYTESDDMQLQAALQHAASTALSAISELYRVAGTSASAKNGMKLQRYFRDMAMAITNPGLQADRMAARMSVQLFKDRNQQATPET